MASLLFTTSCVSRIHYDLTDNFFDNILRRHVGYVFLLPDNKEKLEQEIQSDLVDLFKPGTSADAARIEFEEIGSTCAENIFDEITMCSYEKELRSAVGWTTMSEEMTTYWIFFKVNENRIENIDVRVDRSRR